MWIPEARRACPATRHIPGATAVESDAKKKRKTFTAANGNRIGAKGQMAFGVRRDPGAGGKAAAA